MYDAETDGDWVDVDGSIGRWEDKSTQGNHVTQSSSSFRPFRRDTGVDFNNTAYLGPENFGFTPKTTFIVFTSNQEINTGNGDFFFEFRSVDGIWFGSFTSGMVNEVVSILASAGSSTAAAAFGGSGATVDTGLHIYMVIRDSTDSYHQLWIDNERADSIYRGGGDTSAPDFVASNFILGARSNLDDFLNGTIHEMIVYDRILSSEEIDYLYSYLTLKW